MTVAVKRQMHQNFLPCNTVCWCWNSVFWNRFFSTRDFFHRHWRFTGQQGKGRGHFLFHYTTTSTRLRTFVCFIDIYLQHLFATLHVRWLSRIFNRNACVYQTATRWDLPPYRITIWLIDDAMFVCLLDELILGFCYSNFDMGNRWIELASTITLVLQRNRLTKLKYICMWALPEGRLWIYHTYLGSLLHWRLLLDGEGWLTF